MVEYLIVALIVAAAAWFVALKYLPASLRRKLGQKPAASACGTGCGGCSSGDGCADPAPPAQKVIKLHRN